MLVPKLPTAGMCSGVSGFAMKALPVVGGLAILGLAGWFLYKRA